MNPIIPGWPCPLRHRPNVVLSLGKRRGRWPNNKPASGRYLSRVVTLLVTPLASRFTSRVKHNVRPAPAPLAHNLDSVGPWLPLWWAIHGGRVSIPGSRGWIGVMGVLTEKPQASRYPYIKLTGGMSVPYHSHSQAISIHPYHWTTTIQHNSVLRIISFWIISRHVTIHIVSRRPYV